MKKPKATPEETAAQGRRQRFLKDHGIDAKNQHLAVLTLQQVQDTAIIKTDEACRYYLALWVPELRPLKPKNYEAWMTQNQAIFSATSKERNPITGSHSITYCFYRKAPPCKRAFSINFRITPITTGKGIFRLDVDHKEIPFPANVKIKEEA